MPRDEGKATDLTLASHFSTDRINIRGEPNQRAKLNMNLVSARQSFIQLDMEVLDCPPGFKLKDKSECVCNTKAHKGMFDCDIDSFQSHLVSGYWAGYINDSQNTLRLVMSACPFCNYSLSESRLSMTVSDFEIILPQTHSKLDESVCGVTRTGIVCDKCRDGYTVHFHSPDFMCKPAEPVGCKYGWLFYILSELVPVTVVFIIVLVLNISSWYVNGFILFSQILASFDLNAGGVIMFPLEALRTATQGYQIFYRFLTWISLILNPCHSACGKVPQYSTC